MTVATCVCCSMISDSQIRYGSRVRCHGRSRRPKRRCQAINRAAKDCERSAAEPLPRLARGFRGRVARDDVLERAARTGVVTQLDLTARNVEEGIGDLLAVGIGR